MVVTSKPNLITVVTHILCVFYVFVFAVIGRIQNFST